MLHMKQQGITLYQQQKNNSTLANYDQEIHKVLFSCYKCGSILEHKIKPYCCLTVSLLPLQKFMIHSLTRLRPCIVLSQCQISQLVNIITHSRSISYTIYICKVNVKYYNRSMSNIIVGQYHNL